MWTVAGLLVTVLGCSSPAAIPDVSGADAAADALPDVMIDAPPDAAIDAPPDAAVDAPPSPPPTLGSIAPAVGSVAGNEVVALEGTGFEIGAAVTIGGVPCVPALVESATRITCVTGDSAFAEGAMDVVVTNPDAQAATLAGAFTYLCPWTTSLGRRSCGAVPPRPRFPAQVVTAWVTQLQAGHGFVADTPGAGDELNDTSDAVLGSQSAVIQTDGAGTPRTLTRTGLAPIDFTDRMPKLWVKLEGVAHAASLQLRLGDSGLANHYRFSFHSTQGQKWQTEGDWVAFTLSWSAANVVVQGTPDRAAITDVQLRVVDDATGNPVRFHVNGLGLVAEPVAAFPEGVVSITFDDNFASMVSEGLPPLVARNFPATAYVIADLVDDPGRATLAELRTLHAQHGWEIAAHAHAHLNHAARFPNLSAAVLEDDLVDMRAWLIAHGFSGYDHCAYPGGMFTGGIGTEVLGLVGRYFATCRSIYQGERETYPPADSHKLRVFYITNATTLASAIAAIDQARAHREWIILCFHKLVTTPTVSTEWGIADYAALIDHIAQTGMPVRTIGQVLARSTSP